ncbi:MAG TPA: hypothetical protein VHH73_01915 [Verrucomicrobiae bacterium]|nr:hypothetical protein [Verrucomicrobiae bacterium]
MRDIKSPRILWLKAGLFLVLGGITAGLLLAETPTLRAATLLGLTVWAFCRAYYFAFYVIGNYIDPGHKYAGLLAFASRHFASRRGAQK